MDLILVLIALLVVFLAQTILNITYSKYKRVELDLDISGSEVARKILNEYDLNDISIGKVSGNLSDHYNNSRKVINLSKDIYEGHTIAAASVAAHECGHALQHAQAYSMLQLRSALVPVVSFASHWVQWILLAGIILVDTFPNLLLIGIALFAMTTLFSIITLPVEIDASHRALAWLRNSGITTYESQESAKDALKWAAYTYVIAALSSLATLLYYIMIYLGRRE